MRKTFFLGLIVMTTTMCAACGSQRSLTDEGGPCDPDGACPSGLACDPTGVCSRTCSVGHDRQCECGCRYDLGACVWGCK